jgi:hypothetical protein
MNFGGGIVGFDISKGNAVVDMTCAMVYHKVLPCLEPGDILVADNASFILKICAFAQ